jgi:hypothetical protein
MIEENEKFFLVIFREAYIGDLAAGSPGDRVAEGEP